MSKETPTPQEITAFLVGHMTEPQINVIQDIDPEEAPGVARHCYDHLRRALGAKISNAGAGVEVTLPGDRAGSISYVKLAELIREGVGVKPPELTQAPEQTRAPAPKSGSKLMYVPTDMIYPNPKNPRKNFDESTMAELVTSVRQVGILQPVVLVKDDDHPVMRYRLVAGERRWRAAQEAGLKDMPAVVKELTPEQELEVMIIENLQRRDIDAIEEANGFKVLLEEGGYTQEALAEKIGVSQGHIANRLRLLELPESVRENISRGIISASHGKVLAGYKNLPAPMLEKAAGQIVENETPVAKTEELVSKVIMLEAKALFKTYNNELAFDAKPCRKCEHRIVIKEFGWRGQEKAPYCLNVNCWEEKQAPALVKKQKAEAEKREAEERAEKEREREEAARKRAENEAAKVKIQEHIQKAAEQVRKVEVQAQNPAITGLINSAREIWQEETLKRAAYGYSADPESVAVDKESVITLDGLLEYWLAKNEICKEATSMPSQLGDSTVIIPSQGIRFRGNEPYFARSEKNNAGAIKIDGGALKIENTNGQVEDVLPDLPVYYRIMAHQYTGSKIIKQLVAIKTPTRTIMIFGTDGATMRKEIFTLWIQLAEQLPPVEAAAREGVA